MTSSGHQVPPTRQLWYSSSSVMSAAVTLASSVVIIITTVFVVLVITCRKFNSSHRTKHQKNKTTVSGGYYGTSTCMKVVRVCWTNLNVEPAFGISLGGASVKEGMTVTYCQLVKLHCASVLRKIKHSKLVIFSILCM